MKIYDTCRQLDTLSCMRLMLKVIFATAKHPFKSSLWKLRRNEDIIHIFLWLKSNWYATLESAFCFRLAFLHKGLTSQVAENLISSNFSYLLLLFSIPYKFKYLSSLASIWKWCFSVCSLRRLSVNLFT